ncbi:MAG: SGNH/GDSL hydrolase family protein [Nitrospinae bacterium]|nr:SGNH/GDSL hydrolase family protein [Nitrospinota bacterium]
MTLCVPDRYLGYRLRPGYSNRLYNINSLGFRGKEFSKKKEKGKIRVFCLGGSTTWGDSSSPIFIYPKLLDRMLRDKVNENYEVINAGVAGYTSLQVKRYLESEIVDYNPDFIIVAAGWNDIGQSFRKDWTPQVTLNSIGNGFLENLAVYRLLKKSLLINSKIEYDYRRPNPEAIAFFKENLTSMAETAKKKNIRLIFMEEPIAASNKEGFGNIQNITGFFPQLAGNDNILNMIEEYKKYSAVIKNVAAQYRYPFTDSGLSLDCSSKKFFFMIYCTPPMMET